MTWSATALRYRPWLATLLVAGGSACVEPVASLAGSTGALEEQSSSSAKLAERSQAPAQSSAQDSTSASPPKSSSSSSVATSSATTADFGSQGSTQSTQSTQESRCEDKGADYFCARRPDPDWQGPMALLQAGDAKALASCAPYSSEVKQLRERPDSTAAARRALLFRGCAIARQGGCEEGRICTLKGMGVTCIYRKDEHECPFFFSVSRFFMEPQKDDFANSLAHKTSVLTVCCQSGKGEETPKSGFLPEQRGATPH